MIFNKSVKTSMRKGQSFNKWCWENSVYTGWEPYLTPCTKSNSKWIKNLNTRAKAVTVLEENIGEGSRHRSWQWFLRYDAKNSGNKRRNWTLKTCAARDTINRMKRQRIKMEEIFASHVSDKGLISSTYKELLHLNSNNNLKKLKMHKGLIKGKTVSSQYLIHFWRQMCGFLYIELFSKSQQILDACSTI